MDMMKNGKGGSPMEMCREMMGLMQGGKSDLALITPELQQLFEEWVAHLENEIIEKNKGSEGIGVAQIAEQLGLSKESAVYLIARLASQEKIELTIKI